MAVRSKGPVDANTVGVDDITDINIDKKVFAQQYVGALRHLLPTYPALDTNNDSALDVITDANSPETHGGVPLYNDLLLDLNATVSNAYLDDVTETTVLYSTTIGTNGTLIERTGPAGTTFGENEILPFENFIGRSPNPGEVWYEDVTASGGGDGTVPTVSSFTPFDGDTRIGTSLNLISYNTGHGGLISNAAAQQKILDQIGVTGVTNIEDGLILGTKDSAQRILGLGIIDSTELIAELGTKLLDSPADLVNLISRLGPTLQSFADGLDVPEGVPFVNDAISSIVDFANQTDDLVSKLYTNATVVGDTDLPADGKLTSDALFTVRIDTEDPVFVTVEASETADNTSIDDLYIDVNAALIAAGISATRLIAERPSGADADKLSIRTADPSQGTTLDVSTVVITGGAPAPSSGRLGQDVHLTFNINTENLDTAVDVDVTLTRESTESNTQLRDLIRDLNNAMGVDIGDGTLLNELLVAHQVGESIRISAIDSTTTAVAISGGEDIGFESNQNQDVNSAASELGLGDSQSAVAEVKNLTDVINEILPPQTQLLYDEENRQILLDVQLEETYTQSVDLDFSEAIDLGFADLNLAGGAEASFDVQAGANLLIGIDLVKPNAGAMVDANTKLTDLRDPVSFLVGISKPVDKIDGTLNFDIDRFDGSTDPLDSVSVSLSGLSGDTSTEDVSFALADGLAAHFGVSVEESPVTALFDGDNLVLFAQDPTINQLTVTKSAFGFSNGDPNSPSPGSPDQGNLPDLVITLADGSPASNVVLDGAKTLGEVETKIEAAANVSVTFVDDKIQLVDNSATPNDGRMTIEAASSALGTSAAGAGLGILGTTSTEDDGSTTINDQTTLLGESLLVGSVLDQFFIDTTNSSVFANATLDADDIDLTASLGLLELGVNEGTADFTIGASLALSDNDGALRLSEISDVGFAPSFTYGGTAAFPISIPLIREPDPVNMGQTRPVTVPITLTLQQDPSNPLRPTFDLSGTSVNDLKEKIGDFKNLSLSDIAGMLRQVVDLLRDSDISGLNDTIPVINQTPNELLDFTDGLLAAADKLLAGPDTAQLMALRDQFAEQLVLISATPNQIQQLTDALDRVSRSIDPVHTYKLEITEGANTHVTEMISSTATAMDVEAAINAALNQGDIVDVAGKTGGPLYLHVRQCAWSSDARCDQCIRSDRPI